MEPGHWVFLHILLLVFWLGTDLGVLILARAARRSDLSFPQRAVLVQYAMIIDILPRVCLTLSFAVGLHLAASLGWVSPPPVAFAAAWIIGLLWLALLYALHKAEGTPRHAGYAAANLALQALLGAGVIGLGVASLLGSGPFPAGWLAGKVLLFGLVFFCSIMIDLEFRPMGPAFARLATEGSTPEIEAVIRRTVDRAVVWVAAIYILLLSIAFLGAVKP
jgi:hypothetical protein